MLYGDPNRKKPQAFLTNSGTNQQLRKSLQ